MDKPATLWYARNPTARDRVALRYDDVPMDTLGLSKRISNALRRGRRYRTVGDLIRATPSIVSTRNLGAKSLAEIDAALAPFLGPLPADSPQATDERKGGLAPVAEPAGASWDSIDAQAANERATSLEGMPIQDWGLPPTAEDLLTDGLGYRTVADALREIPTVRLWVERFAPTQEPEVIAKLAATVHMRDPAVATWLDSAPAAPSDTTLPASAAGEPIELLVLPAAVLDECLLQGAYTIGDVVRSDGLPDAVYDAAEMAVQAVRPGDGIRWETYWQSTGLAVIEAGPRRDEDLLGDGPHIASGAMVLETARRALDQRNPQKWTVVKGRLGLRGDRLTLQELASGLGVTRERVRQIQVKALATISKTIVRPDPTEGHVATAPVIRFAACLRRALYEWGGWISQAAADEAVRDVSLATAPDNAPAIALVLSALGCKRHTDDLGSRSPVWVSPSATSFMPGALSSLRSWATDDLQRPHTEPEMLTLLQARWPGVPDSAVRRLLETSSCLEPLPNLRWQAGDTMLKRSVQRVERLLLEADSPLHITAIVRRMSVRWGVESGSVTERNVAAALGRNELFVALGRSGCWGLAEWADGQSRPCVSDSDRRASRPRRKPALKLTPDAEARIERLLSQPAWQRYDSWNGAFAQEFFSGRYAQRPVYLDLEPQALRRMADHVGSTADEPSDDLVAAVRDTLQLRSGGRSTFSDHRLRVRDWLLRGRIGPPPCLALLGMLSLVAEGMHGDEDYASHNYYGRLGKTLGLDHDDTSAKSRLCNHFRKETHALWDALNYWLSESDGARGHPTANAFDRRVHVGLPISQALLREGDRERLRYLFIWHRLRPHQVVSNQDMQRLLGEWLKACRPGGAIQRLWKPATRQQLVTTAVVELERWDGAGPEAHPGDAELRLHAQLRRMPAPSLELWLGARMGQGVAEGQYVLDEGRSSSDASAAIRGALSFEAGDDTWLDLVDGDISYPDLLFAHVHLSRPDSSVGMVRMARRVVVLEWDNTLQRFIEVDRVQLGQESLLLVQELLSETVADILATVARPGYEPWTHDQLRGLAAGWRAFGRVQVVDIADTTDEDLTPLVPIGWTTVTLGGGMALPGGSVWLTSHPPELRFSSLEGQEVNAEIQIRELGSEEAAQPISLGARLGTWVYTLTDGGLLDGDYTVVLRRGGSKSRVLATRSFRLRSASSPRTLADDEQLWVGRDLDPTDGWFGVGAVELPSPPARNVQGCLVAGVEHGRHDSRGLPSPPQSLSRANSHAEDEVHAPPVQSSQMRGAAPAPCLVGQKAHYWMLAPGYPGQQRGSDGQCKHCALEKWFPARPSKKGKQKAAAAASTISRSPAHPHPPLSVPAISPETEADLDDIMEALCYLGQGPWSAFKRVAHFASDEPWYPLELARVMEGLGHIEVARDRRSLMPARWAIVPTTLALLPASRGAVLCGFRSAEILDAVEDAVTALGFVLKTHSAAGSPTAFRVPGLDVRAALRVAQRVCQATGTEVHVAADAAQSLLNAAPTLAEIRTALPERYVPSDSTVTRLDLTQLRWRGQAEVAAAGAYQIRGHRFWYGYVGPQLANTGRCQVADSHLVKWMAAADVGMALLAHDPASNVLICPLSCQLPPLHERAAVLCSGVRPTKRKDGTVTYDAVPSAVAARLWSLLGPSQGTR